MSLKAGWASSWKGHIYLPAQRGHKSQQLQLSSTHFGKYFWLVWFYAFRVPFLSPGLVQTHWSWAEASKEDAEFHTDLCWVCKNFSDLSKLLCWETKTKIINPRGVCRVLWFSSETTAKAVVSHVTYKPKGFIMKPEKKPTSFSLKIYSHETNQKEKKKKKKKENLLNFGLEA